MKLFLFPKGTVTSIIVFALHLCHLSVFGSDSFASNTVNNPPFALKSVVLSDTSVHLSWLSSNVPNETEWDLEIVREGTVLSGTPTHLGIASNNPFLIDTLQSGTKYSYKVRAICAGVAGAWSTETRTFFTHILNKNGCGIDLEIPDVSCNNPIPYPIQVRNESGTSLGSDVILQEVQLIIEHDWLIDLELWLRSPTGLTVRLIDENGGTQNNFGDPTDLTCTQHLALVNSNACGEPPIQGAGPPYIGRYLPIGNLNTFNDNSDPNGIWELIICDDAATNIGSLKFVELVFTPVTCTPPTGLTVTAIDSTSVTLDWAPGGFCDSTVYEYGPPGFTLGMGTQVPATCPPFTLSGLTGGSLYEIYIYENCGGGNIAISPCTSITIETACSPPPMTILADFDNLPNCRGVSCNFSCDIDNYSWQNARNEKLDWSVYSTGTPSVGTGPVADVSGTGKFIYMEVSSFNFFGSGGCSFGDEAVLLSNCFTIDTKNTDTCHVSFYYHMFGNGVNNLKFQITTDGSNWTNLWTKNGNQGNHWNQVKLSLTPYNGMPVQFRFVGVRGNGNLGDIGLDEITFYGSIDNGEPIFTFYKDNDGDGFGSDESFVQNCFNYRPPGFVNNDMDCDDFNPNVNAMNQEIPCNGIDENCNGNDDDRILPAPQITGAINVCEGEIIKLTATPNFGGNIIWCDSFCLNQNLNFSGDTLIINGLSAVNGLPTVYQYHAYEELFFFCYSGDSAVVDVIVNPRPIISTQAEPVICAGEVFDLSTLQINDQNSTVGFTTFHSGFPATTANFLSSSLVSPTTTTDYYIRKIANGGCEDTTMVTINVLPSPTAILIPNQDTVEICKGTNVFLTGYGTGGVPNYSQQWSTFETTSSITVNSSGVGGEANLVTYTVTDQNQCANTDSIVVKTVSSVDTLQITNISPVSFCFGNDGSISLTPIDGIADYKYEWFGPVQGFAFASGAFTIDNLQQGSYSVTVTDNSPEGCEFVLNNLVVDGPSAVVFLDSIRPASCFGENDGGIFLSVSGNNPTIQWSNFITSTSDDVTGLAAGIYSVTVTDGGCQTTLSNIEVPQPELLTALSNSTDVSCFGGNDGKINIGVFGGTPNYSYQWNNAAPVKNPSFLAMGDYYFTITDGNGCVYESDTIEILEPTELSILVNQKLDPKCFDEATGFIDVIANGGTSPYQYFWSDNGVGRLRSGLMAGTYDVTVIDANGCQNMQTSIILNNPPALMVDTLKVTDASCFGVADGAIDMIATGGSGTLGFQWNTNEVTQDISDLEVGTYVLTVFDVNGCTAVSDSIKVSAPDNLNVNFSVKSPFCVGTSGGEIDLEVDSGGTPPYTFLWSDSTVNEDLKNVPVGFYDVTITHADGCISTFSDIEVDAPQLLDGSSIVSLSPTCHGDSTGRIFSNILGANTPFNYNWSNGFTSQDLNNLTSGFYDLTVTDNKNCKLKLDSIEIIENDSLTVQIIAFDAVGCYNDSTGSITVQASGGIPDYNFSWNGGVYSGDNISGLPPGGYNLTLTDGANCILEFPSIVLKNAPEIVVDYQVCLDPDCSGGLQRDTIKLSATGGLGNLHYLWSDSTMGANLTNIPPGEYEVTVTDDNDCQVVVEEMKVPTAPSSFYFNNFEKSDVSCFGNEDGSICISFSGGAPPYRYLWSDGNGTKGQTDSTIICLSNEEEGKYILTVVDSNECEINSVPIEILEPNPIVIDVLAADDVTCFGGSDGEITSFVSGGNPPYDFTWVNTITQDSVIFSQSANSFPEGEYVLAVTDNIGCSDVLVEPVLINEPDSFFINLVNLNHVQCFDDTTGLIEIEIGGGTPPVNAFWDNNLPSGFLQKELPPNLYKATVADNNGCVISETFRIIGPTSGMIFSNVTSKNPVCHNDSNGEISFSVTGGAMPYQYFIDDDFLSDPIVTDLPSGTFEIMVIDSNQCKEINEITLINPPQLEVTILEQPVTAGGNWMDGSLTADVSGGIGSYSYEWSTGDSTQTIDNLVYGWYYLTVEDAAGCSTEIAFLLDFTNLVNELEIDGEIILLPNPTDGFVQIDFQLNSFESFDFLLLDQNGKLIQKNNVDVSFRTSLDIDLTKQPSGTYYFVLQKDNAWKSWKITKI